MGNKVPSARYIRFENTVVDTKISILAKLKYSLKNLNVVIKNENKDLILHFNVAMPKVPSAGATLLIEIIVRLNEFHVLINGNYHSKYQHSLYDSGDLSKTIIVYAKSYKIYFISDGNHSEEAGSQYTYSGMNDGKLPMLMGTGLLTLFLVSQLHSDNTVTDSWFPSGDGGFSGMDFSGLEFGGGGGGGTDLGGAPDLGGVDVDLGGVDIDFGGFDF